VDIYAKGLGFPLALAAHHGIDVVSVEQSVQAMIEQMLFTSPGERVNRPTFGVGAPRYVFEPNSPLLAERLRSALEDNVYEDFGTSVNIVELTVEQDEEQLIVRIGFEIVGTVSGPQDLEVIVPIGGQS
jgi:phage baseplate assembly protein W